MGIFPIILDEASISFYTSGLGSKLGPENCIRSSDGSDHIDGDRWPRMNKEYFQKQKGKF